MGGKLNVLRIIKRRVKQFWTMITQDDDCPKIPIETPEMSPPDLEQVSTAMNMTRRHSIAEDDLGFIDSKFFVHEMRVHFGEKVCSSHLGP